MTGYSFMRFEQLPVSRKLLLSLFVLCVGFVGGMVLAALATFFIYGIGPIELAQVISQQGHPQYIGVLKIFQVFQSIGVFIASPFIIAWLFSVHPAQFLKFNRIQVSLALIAIISLLAFIPGINWLATLNDQMRLPGWLQDLEWSMREKEEAAHVITNLFLQVESFPAYLFNIFMIALIPAIGEELLFRRVFQQLFTDWTRNVHWGIWISAALFSFIHFQFFGFFPRMLLGVLFGYLLYWSNSIWLPVVCHFVNNALAVSLSWLVYKKSIPSSVETFGAEGFTQRFSLIGAVLGIGLLVLLYRMAKKPSVQEIRS